VSFTHQSFDDEDATSSQYTIEHGALGVAWHVSYLVPHRSSARVGVGCAATPERAVALMRADLASRNRPWPGRMNF
jgi:hypothetical protein